MVLCGLCATAACAQTVIYDFEYASEDDLRAEWEASANAAVGLSTDVAAGSAGDQSLRLDFQFPSIEWATETAKGPWLAEVLAADPAQYLSLRLKGDPAFLGADFRTFYLYAYDDAGNFGRWGTAIPTTPDWKVINFQISAIEKPWDAPALPDFTRLARFAFFQYGSQTAIEPYAASIQVDDLSLRDTPLSEDVAGTESVVEAFEYASTDDLVAAWQPSANAVVELSDSVAPRSTGKTSLKATFNFQSIEWATESVRGPELASPLTIAPGQFLTLRIQGDSAFAAADFRSFYLYAYDDSGNFGRWGAPVPTTADWQILNFAANLIEKPWDAPALPDLARIVRFAVFQYGSQAAIEPYTASIHLDDIEVRNAPLTEFPPASAPRSLIDDFEGYTSDESLMAFYGYMNSPATTTTSAGLETPAPQGARALRLAIGFSAGQYPWGSVRSPVVAPFSLPTNAVVSVRFKGDASLASVADAATSFWVTFYDAAGSPIHYSTDAAPVISPEWTQITARFADFRGTDTADVGNLVRWRILVQGWEGTAESAEASGTFVVDDIRVEVPAAERPTLTLTRNGAALVLGMEGLVAGTTYEVRTSSDLRQWSRATEIQATSSTATWGVTPGGASAFYQVVAR